MIGPFNKTHYSINKGWGWRRSGLLDYLENSQLLSSFKDRTRITELRSWARTVYELFLPLLITNTSKRKHNHTNHSCVEKRKLKYKNVRTYIINFLNEQLTTRHLTTSLIYFQYIENVAPLNQLAYFWFIIKRSAVINKWLSIIFVVFEDCFNLESYQIGFPG